MEVWVLVNFECSEEYEVIENDTNILIIHCGANSFDIIDLKSLLVKLHTTREQIAKLFLIS